MVSLTRMLKQAFSESASSPDTTGTQQLPPIRYPSETEQAITDDHQPDQTTAGASATAAKPQRQDQQLRAQRVSEAVAEVNDIHIPTPLTDRYLALKNTYRHPNRPPFDPNTLWVLKHGRCPIMTELINVVDERTLNAMPIEAVAILDRINHKLRRYREWSTELNGTQQEWFCERQFVIDKLINESIPEALNHYEQLLRFSPYRTKHNTVHGNMTAGDMLTDLFLEIDYELDELLDELHSLVLNRLASTHRYVKSRTQS